MLFNYLLLSTTSPSYHTIGWCYILYISYGIQQSAIKLHCIIFLETHIIILKNSESRLISNDITPDWKTCDKTLVLKLLYRNLGSLHFLPGPGDVESVLNRGLGTHPPGLSLGR